MEGTEGLGLVYHAGALGDFITALPAIARFRAGCRGLILLGRPEHGELAAHLFLETWDAGAALFAGLFSESREPASRLADRFRGVTSGLLFAAPGSSLPSALARLGVTTILRQDPFPGSAVAVVDYHLSLFPGPFTDEDRIPRLAVAPAPDSSRTGTAIAFGSGSLRKNWPIERFIEIGSRLSARGQTVRWIEGPAENGRCPVSRDQAWSTLPLVELASRLSRCRLFVGNDSGVAHMAAAAGCATVVLFGPSDARVWSPRGRQVRAIVSPSGNVDDIGTEDVFRTCLDLLEKT